MVRETLRRWPFHIDAWVVLPDRLHSAQYAAEPLVPYAGLHSIFAMCGIASVCQLKLFHHIVSKSPVTQQKTIKKAR